MDNKDAVEEMEESGSSLSSSSSTSTLPAGSPLQSSTEVNLNRTLDDEVPTVDLSEFLILHSPRREVRESSLTASADTEEVGGSHSGYEASGEGSSATEIHSSGEASTGLFSPRNPEAGPSIPNRSTRAARFSIHSSSPEDSFTYRRHRQGVGHASFGSPVSPKLDSDERGYRTQLTSRIWTTPSTQSDAEAAGEPRAELPAHLIMNMENATAEDLGIDISESSHDSEEWYPDHGDTNEPVDAVEEMETDQDMAVEEEPSDNTSTDEPSTTTPEL